MLKKLIEKKRKEGKEMDPLEKHAKMSNLHDLRKVMSGMMKDDLDHPGMKKVEVASPDAEGLSAGLDKAKELVGSDDESADGDESDDVEGSEADDESAPEAEPMLEDEIKHEASEGELSDEEIEKLEMLLEKLKKSKMK